MDNIVCNISKNNSMTVNIAPGGKTGGTNDYERLINLPLVNGVELIGDKSLEDLGIKQNYTATDINYKSTNVNDVLDDLNEKMEDILYKPIVINSFSNNINTVEIGRTIDTIVFNWSINKKPKTLLFENSSIDIESSSKTITEAGLRTNKTFTLKATDDREATSTKNTAITFLNGVYYGVKINTTNFTNEFILSLTKTLQGNRVKTFTVNAGAEEHIYYCIPTRYGIPTFKVGGFEGGFDKVSTFNFTNSSGYSENYDVYKSTNANLGNTTVEAR